MVRFGIKWRRIGPELIGGISHANTVALTQVQLFRAEKWTGTYPERALDSVNRANAAITRVVRV